MHSVLIVDDERMIINSLVFGFDWKGSGFEVVATATNGREALALISSAKPEVVLTDVKMPGLTGIELMEQCRELEAPPLFVIISGHAEFRYAQDAIRLGAAGYCLKPVENEELAEILQQIKGRLEDDEARRNRAMGHFLTAPSPENARPLLAGFAEGQPIAVGLSDGAGEAPLKGVLPATALRVGERCRMYLIQGDLTALEGYPFRSALLAAVTEGQLSAFVYDVTSQPESYLCNSFEALCGQLYAGFFNPGQNPLGRVEPQSAEPTAFSEKFRSLCNHNRPKEAIHSLSSLSPEEQSALRLGDAVTVHNQCQTLLCRMKNQPCPTPLRFGFEVAERYGSFEAMVKALCRELSHMTGPAFNADQLHNETLRQVVTEINGSFTKEISFQELSTRHCINPSYLSQLFKKELGTTFTNYLNALRMDYARELLETTNLLVSEISDKAGYDSYLTFTKLFKRETGVTPKQYRNQAQQG
ncbi:MAG: response regulator [Eubacteriales bacterium]|nr:response regulator [Eubacteriales bacterium]